MTKVQTAPTTFVAVPIDVEWAWVSSSFGPRIRHVILTLEPNAADRRYLEADARQYALLRAGMSPDDLLLDEVDQDELEGELL